MAARTGEIARCLYVLGLESGASEDEIKRSYKKLALTHHPDKNAEDPRATRKFQELSEAYTYLMKRTEIEEEEDGYIPFEDDLDLLDLLRLFAHLNGHHCGIWAHPTGWCHGQSSSVFFQDNDDFYPDEPLFYREPPSDSSKAKSYSDRYQFSCEQSSSEDYCHLNAWKTSLKEKCAKTVGAGDNGGCRNTYQKSFMSSPATPEIDKVTRERRKAEKLRQRRERLEQEAKQQKAKMKTNCQDGNSQPTNTVHDSDVSRGQRNCDRGQAKKPSKKQLLAEQRRRQKEMAAIAEELQHQCHLAAEKERRRREREEEKQSGLKECLGEGVDLGDDLEIPPADTKAERRQSVGPTKARRKREAKQKRRLARIQNKSKTAEMKDAEMLPSQPCHTNGVMSATRHKVASDEEWTEECDQFLDDYTGFCLPVSPSKTAASAILQPARVMKGASQPSRNMLFSTAASNPNSTSAPSRLIDSVQHNNMFRSTSNAQHRYNVKFASGFCARRPGSHNCDEVVDQTLEWNEFNKMPTGDSEDWYEECPQVVTGKRCPAGPVHSNSHVSSEPLTRAGDLCTFTDITGANGSGGSVNNYTPPHQTVKGYRLVAPSAWSEPLEQPVKNVWSERQQFVNEALPQSREEEEEMFHVALEMSRLQMQEDALRREMWEQEQALQQFH